MLAVEPLFADKILAKDQNCYIQEWGWASHSAIFLGLALPLLTLKVTQLDEVYNVWTSLPTESVIEHLGLLQSIPDGEGVGEGNNLKQQHLRWWYKHQVMVSAINWSLRSMSWPRSGTQLDDPSSLYCLKTLTVSVILKIDLCFISVSLTQSGTEVFHWGLI